MLCCLKTYTLTTDGRTSKTIAVRFIAKRLVDVSSRSKLQTRFIRLIYKIKLKTITRLFRNVPLSQSS